MQSLIVFHVQNLFDIARKPFTQNTGTGSDALLVALTQKSSNHTH